MNCTRSLVLALVLRLVLAFMLALAPTFPIAAVAGTALAAADVSLGLPSLAAAPKMPHAAKASRAAQAAKVSLGRKLFFDRRLSINGTLSCAMCHVPEQGFTVNELRTSVGMEGVSLRRNAPTLLNVRFVDRLFVDGRAASLQEQALQPMVHPDEMANPDVAAVMARIAAMPDYRAPLRRAFGSPSPTPDRVAGALAAYERTLIAGGSPFDRWRYGGEAAALGPPGRRGFELFRARGCVNCHTVEDRHALFSDGAFHNVGVQARSEALRDRSVAVTLIPGLNASVSPETMRRIGAPDLPDRGRFEVTGRNADLRAYRTPSLRNVALTAPYMHDGSLDTLEAVLDHYANGGTPGDPAQDALIRPFALDAADREALIAFLRALTSPAAQARGLQSATP